MKHMIIQRLLFAVSSLIPVCSTLSAAEKSPLRDIDAGAFHVSVSLSTRWSYEVIQSQSCIIFRYADAKVPTAKATVAIFRLIVPPEARRADPLQLANAYVIADVSGAQAALLKNRADLALESKKPGKLPGGSLYSYLESIDARHARESSTAFTHGAALFPDSFANDGAFFLLLGKEEFVRSEIRPDELDLIRDIAAGLQTK